MNERPIESPGFSAQTFDEIERLRRDSPGKYFCPVCGTSRDRFNPGGVVRRRPNAKCPECGSLERHRLLMMHLANCVWPNLPAGKKDLLHIAPEKFLVERLKPRADVNYVSGDLMSSDCMARLDLTDMPFWDKQFDLIICSHVLEHIPDDLKAMKDLYRVLKDGGYLLVMVPLAGDKTYEDPSITEPSERVKHFGQADHVRRYGRDITKRLERAGFETQLWPAAHTVEAGLLEAIASKQRQVIECRRVPVPGRVPAG